MTLNLDLAGFPCSEKLAIVNLIQGGEIAQPASPEAAGRDGAVSSALRECLGGVGGRGRLGVENWADRAHRKKILEDLEVRTLSLCEKKDLKMGLRTSSYKC